MRIAHCTTFLLLLLLALSSCSRDQISDIGVEARVAATTKSQQLLASLPPAEQKVVLSVYDFQDRTGQHKPNDAYAEYSRAVTQGATAILYKALLDTGNQGWFQVIEREGLDNLLQERKIVRAMREQYKRSDGSELPEIGPMLYAGVLLEGGIISYESNVLTGGLGARYLGIGGDTQYRHDIVTVYLRLVSVQSGEILLSVNSSKTIYSTLVRGSIFKYIGINELLEIESGFTVNEPPQFAVRQAIEMGVYSLVMEGALQGLWSFADPLAGKMAVQDYMLRKQGKSVPLRNYTELVKQIRKQEEAKRRAAMKQRRRAISPDAGAAFSPHSYSQQGISAPMPGSVESYPIAAPSQQPPQQQTQSYNSSYDDSATAIPPSVSASYPSGAAAVKGHAQIPPDTRYVPGAAEPLESTRQHGSHPANGGGLYDYKVYCTRTGCRAVNPAP